VGRSTTESNEPSWVYFIRAGDGPVKIGKANDPWARMSSLQVGVCDAQLHLIALVPGDVRHEEGFHLRFHKLSIRGEWFEASDDLLAFCADHDPNVAAYNAGRAAFMELTDLSENPLSGEGRALWQLGWLCEEDVFDEEGGYEGYQKYLAEIEGAGT
jgi:hypothetical protein